MTGGTWREALEVVVARTGHQRYRALCDDAHPGREVYRGVVMGLAGFAPPPVVAAGPIGPAPRPRASEVMDAMGLVKACPHRSRDAGCGCSGSRCALGKGRAGLVTHRDCLACVGLAVTG